MTAQKGRDLLVKVDDGTGNFITIAGLRTRRLSFNADTVDTTDSESIGRWRELLGGAGVRRASLSGNGVFKDAASDALMRQIFFDGIVCNWKIIIPDFGIVTGLFLISSLDWRGEHSGEVTFDVALESAGSLVFAAI